MAQFQQRRQRAAPGRVKGSGCRGSRVLAWQTGVNRGWHAPLEQRILSTRESDGDLGRARDPGPGR